MPTAPFKSKYDVIVIGASLAGLSCALELKKHGYDVLVLEQHNLPGGVATSFVRGGVEIEASLHEMIGVGSDLHPLRVRRYFEKLGAKIDWVRIPYCYRFVSGDIDVRIRAGHDGDYSAPSLDIANACGDPDGKLFQKLMDFFALCHKVYQSANSVNTGGKINKLSLYFKHHDFVTVAGYSTKEVFEAFKFPQKVIDILSAYWIYMASPIDELPFTLYGYMIADYFGYGPYIPAHTSHDMSANLEAAAEKQGIQVEFCQKVDKIVVNNCKVQGVRLASGQEIAADFVVSGAYPNTVYSSMIEPKSEVPPIANKTVRAMEVSVSVFSVILLLDASADELGITDYATFYATDGMDTSAIFDRGRTDRDWDYITSVCPNVVHKDASPEGTCLYSITYLPGPDAFEDIDLEHYQEYKDRHVADFLDKESKRLGVNLQDHILEIVVETPLTVSHYTGAYHGAIYGYRNMMNNHAVARTLTKGKEYFIDGLAFAGAHQICGDGMAPAFDNGLLGAQDVMAMDAKRKGAKR
ncbi:MAG: NAD(P)/FAD-dependent oxidoreductase [Bacilli bacterium]|nr:NAD(P)/FAD-dependent oxidoreductase [Bacilli bacterium]